MILKSVKQLAATADAAKQEFESEVGKLYERYHSCNDPEKKAAIKREIDRMIASVERKKGDTEKRLSGK